MNLKNIFSKNPDKQQSNVPKKVLPPKANNQPTQTPPRALANKTQPTPTPNNLKDALKLVADITGEAKKAAAEKPNVTSTGRPKSELKGATVTTNRLKEEGIEAHKRGIVPEPTMEGGIRNNDMYNAATSGLKTLELSDNQNKSLPKAGSK